MKQRGFTVLELIVAIGIMGAAALIGIPSLSGVQTRSELKSDILTGAQIGQAMLIKNLEDGNTNSYLNQQVKYEYISNIDVYVSSGYTPLVMENGYYVVSQVKVDEKIVLMVGITKDGQVIEKTSIYDGKVPGWIWCQAGEIEKFLKENGDKIVIEDETPVEESKIYIINATATVNGEITPAGEIQVTSGQNKVFTSSKTIDKENVAYVFKNWEIDGETVEDEGNDNIYTFIDVQDDHTIKAIYEEKDKYQLTVDLDGIIMMNTNILPGQDVTIGSNANECSVEGVTVQTSENPFTFKMPENEVKITGNY